MNCLNAGGYGPVVITKPITIDCEGTFGGILAGGTTGILVDTANATDAAANAVSNATK